MCTPIHKAALAVAILLATIASAGSANANTMTVEPEGHITELSEGRITFTGRGTIEIAQNCRLTLNGAWNRTINNSLGGSVGSITEGRANECNTGEVRVQTETAWPMELAETGRLEGSPKSLTIIKKEGKISTTIAGISCQYRGDLPARHEGEGFPWVSRLVHILANAWSRVAGSVFCPARISLEGIFSITSQTIRL